MMIIDDRTKLELRVVSEESRELTEAIKKLAKLPDEVFWCESFLRNVYTRKWSHEKMLDLGSQANACGVRYASELKADFPAYSIEKLCRENGIVMEEFAMPFSPNMEIFALFEPPDKISIRTDLLKNCDGYFSSSGLYDVLGIFSSKEVILAHEFFHYIENRDEGNIFTRCYKEPCGFFKHYTEMPPLGEIAAMGFARALLGLSWSPFLLDCAMMGMNDMISAMAIANRLLASQGVFGTPIVKYDV